MLSDSAFRSRLQVTITTLRYWAPSIADAADIDESETREHWRISVAPRLASTCPFELILRTDQHYDLTVAGEEYDDRPIRSLEMFASLADAIASGAVVQRRWHSALSGAELARETLVRLPGGQTWRDGTRPLASLPERVVSTDRHYLPYRRSD